MLELKTSALKIVTVINDSLATFKNRVVFPWVIAFLALNLLATDTGGANPASRFTALRSMSYEYTFRINSHVEWTSDWSKTPAGNYYSNKAPGPILLAFPFVWVLDRMGSVLSKEYWQTSPRLPFMILICLFVQILPFMVTVLLGDKILREVGASKGARHFTMLAILFGNTADIYFNIFFGHGVTAWTLFASFIAMMRGRSFWCGLFFGLALLSDYGVAILILPFLWVLSVNSNSRSFRIKDILHVGLGGVLPAILWIGYHTACFGSPFLTALHFQNPDYLVNEQRSGSYILGVFQMIPDFHVLKEILFGQRLGLLFTQPWIFIAYGIGIVILLRGKKSDFTRPLLVFNAFSLPALILLNASFNGWHGGSSVGPRYICMIFPLIGFALGFCFDYLNATIKVFLWGGLAIALVLRALVFSGSVIYDWEMPIWTRFGRFLFSSFEWSHATNFALFWFVLLFAAWRISVREKNDVIQS